MVETFVARPFKIFQTQPEALVSGIQLLGAAPGIPLRLEVGQLMVQLATIYPITTLVRLGSRGIHNA
jgi:hypothetical protein